MKKNGFTLIELLTIIVVLGLVLVISIPRVINIIENTKMDVYLKNETKLIDAAKEYMMSNMIRVPKEIGNTSEVTLDELKEEGLIEKLMNPKTDSECNGYVLVTKVGDNEFDYIPHINCLNDVGSATEDGLVGYWKLDGNALDYSLNNNHGTIYGASPTTNRFNKENKAINFDGIDDYISSVMTIDSIKALSIWVKVDSIPSDSRIIFVHKPSAIGLGFYQGNSFILKSGSPAETSRRSNLGDFKVGEWNHIVINYDSSYIPTVFINGKEVSSYLSSNYWTEISNDMFIGKRSTGNYFIGHIDDISIYNRQLNTNEIIMMYNIEQYKMNKELD